MLTIYKTSVINTKTNEVSIRFCETEKGLSYAVCKAIESVEANTIFAYLPNKWIIETEIVAKKEHKP